jgi:uncharacterized integral membrane protein (TIGR00697 family)
MNNIFILLLQLTAVIVCTTYASKGPRGLLLCWIVFQSILANLFVLKPVDLFGFSASPSDAFAVGTMISLNLLQQQEGRKAASIASMISIGSLGIFALFAKIHLLLLPSHNIEISEAYQTILSHSPRLLFASMGAFWLSQQFDLRLFGWVSNRWPSAPFFAKTVPSTLLSQTFDTALFTLLGLYGLVDGLVTIFIISSLTKWLTAIFLGTITSLIVTKKPTTL